MSRKSSRIIRYRALFLLCTALGWSMTVWSQQSPAYIPHSSTAIDQADSRAEQEAEQMVSLSADKITQILESEAGYFTLTISRMMPSTA
jgi:hypothetical protein